MEERLIAHWPPPHADEDRIEDTEEAIFQAVRTHLLNTDTASKKSKIRKSTHEQLMYEMSGELHEEIQLCFGILSKNFNHVLGEIRSEDVPEIINNKLCPEVRAQMAYILVWSFVYDIQDTMTDDPDCCADEEDENEDEFGLNLWTPSEQLVLPEHTANADLTDRAAQLELINAIDAQTGLRDLYISIIFGKYGEGNERNITV